MSKPSQERLIKDIYRVLEHPFCIPELAEKNHYIRLHDDSGGTHQGDIVVSIIESGDVLIKTNPSHDGGSLRFRTHRGGGTSQRVRNALLILALAIKLDNKEHPQGVKPYGDS